MRHTNAIRELHRPARLAALDRARVARERVIHFRAFLRTAYCVFTATLSALAGAGVGTLGGCAVPAAANDAAGPDAWNAYSFADLDAMHDALTKADDGMMGVYNQPRTDIEGPAGAFLFQRLEDMRRTANQIVEAVRARKAETVAELDTQWRILARAASGLENYAMERELAAMLMARHEMARLRGAPGA